MVYVTGDKHGTIDCNDLSHTKFPQGKSLTKNDYVIVCGDFGVFWGEPDKDRKYLLNFYNQRHFTTLVLHGNHDNIPAMEMCPEIPMFGSTVKQLSDSVFYLLDSHIYTIEEKTYFVLGGGLSIDKLQRREGTSWWREEIPEYMTIKNGFNELEKIGNKVDFVLTHAVFKDAYEYIFRDFHGYKESDPMHEPLQVLHDTIYYTKWFCGHYHEDMYLEQFKVQMLYHSKEKV